MYISEICIEGFKSYAQRVTLPNFDQSFNAITGLNGSGKSNILDSICFVLGIKNLSQVRAANLQELVYKQGQAGVTKATVSVTWHNNEPASGPAGYEDKEYITVTRQIVVGGRNKYLINGHAAQENRVQDFFHSVQLNVNNPHFLIMQGRITKVLNMKPPEILSLLEEAAGTRMYEKKKEAALRTLDKKQERLNQIDQVLNEDILPSLEALRTKCADYNEWAKLDGQRERLLHILVAYDYTECGRQSSAFQVEATKLQEQLQGNEQRHVSTSTEKQDLEGTIKELQTEKEIQAGGEICELQAQVDALSLELTKGTTHWKSKMGALETEKASLKALQASEQQLAAQDLAGQLVAAEGAASAAAAKLSAAQAAVEAAQCELAGAEAGDGRDHTNRSLKERLSDTQREVTCVEAEQKAAEVKVKLLADQLATSKKALAACGKEAAAAQAQRTKQQAAIASCQEKIQALGYDAERQTQLEGARDAAQREARVASDQKDRLRSDVQGCDFNYQNPGGSFNPACVHGVLARLVRVERPSDSLALEVTAGGKLYQVVVDDDKTAKQLLQGGRLTRRVTIIPLNKVQYNQMSPAVMAAAEKLSGGQANPALQLVGYAAEVEAAVKYAFGSAFVCQDAGTAKKLAFHRDVHTRCVTLEGDDFNPSGLLTGGARASSRSLLASLHALGEAEAALAGAKQRIAEAEAELRQGAGKAGQFKKLQGELELATRSLELLEERLAGTQAAQMASSCEELSAELESVREAVTTAAARRAELKASAQVLEAEVAEMSGGQAARVKGAQAKLKSAKADLEKCKTGAKAAEQAVRAARAEQEGSAEEAKALAGRVRDAEAACQALTQEAAALKEATAGMHTEHEAAAERLGSKRARLKECDKDIAGHEKALAKLARTLQELEGEARKLDTKYKSRAGEAKRMLDNQATLERDHEWVARDKARFGTGDYDFAKHDLKTVKRDYDQAEKRLGELKGKVHSKHIGLLTCAETEYKALQGKRGIVENDRKRINEVIDELDDQKRVAMEATWIKVDHDFGSIFSTLLPGTLAKLQPPEGGTFQDGLEVRVAFGGVWKGSLTELSGGQRSLLALSLILALCRFKPAPLYILDEVDAALDLNHTQNIGRMIRQHFPQSQFVVVSLKEGMFSNANVIFRTRFVDGVSNVLRTVPSAAEAAMRGANDATPGQPVGKAGAGRQAARARAPLAEVN